SATTSADGGRRARQPRRTVARDTLPGRPGGEAVICESDSPSAAGAVPARARPCPLGAGIAVPPGPGTTRPRAWKARPEVVHAGCFAVGATQRLSQPTAVVRGWPSRTDATGTGRAGPTRPQP